MRRWKEGRGRRKKEGGRRRKKRLILKLVSPGKPLIKSKKAGSSILNPEIFKFTKFGICTCATGAPFESGIDPEMVLFPESPIPEAAGAAESDSGTGSRIGMRLKLCWVRRREG
jgi:hypothetical protein